MLDTWSYFEWEFLNATFLVLTLFLLHINDLPDDANAICSFTIYAGDTTLYSKSLVLLNWKWMCQFMSQNHIFKMLGLSFSSKLDWGSYIISISKIVSSEIGALIRSMNFLSPGVDLYFYKSIIRSCMKYYYHVWTGAPSYYLEILDKLKNGYERLLVLHFLPRLSPWLIVEI